MPIMTPPPSGIKIRMYRYGVGDCFLLAFAGKDGEAVYMLIDCGRIFTAVRDMDEVVADIAESTGHHLHVLVATHEHADHLSAFNTARAIFNKITIDHVWLAWTEDPNNELATELRGKRAMAFQALRMAVTRLQAAESPSAELIQNLLAFYGDDEDEPFALTGDQGRSNLSATGDNDADDFKNLPKSVIYDAINYVNKRGNPTTYLKPGQPPLEMPGVEGLRIFVLGPPEDKKLIKKSKPSKKDPEVYHLAGNLNATSAFIAAVHTTLSEDTTLEDLNQPFDSVHRISREQLNEKKNRKLKAFFNDYYGLSNRSQKGKELAWRRIDTAWLQSAEDLALKLDRDTNNTSLVLAFEFDDGRVLLFPGDAQVGNWLSWHTLKWTEKEGLKEGETVTGTDLVSRTVFYKVGHHGSHNATLSDQGLELMNSPELVAMIPVFEKEAKKHKGWFMPFAPLYDRLKERTNGRVLRADTGLPPKPSGVSSAEWKKFTDQTFVPVDKLYVEYTVSGTVK